MKPILAVEDLHTHFLTKEGTARVVNGVEFTLEGGSVLAMVGESGAGKTMTALSIMGIVPYPGKVVKGRVLFDGKDLLALDAEELRRARGSDISMVFQNPQEALNPIMRVGDQVEEVFLVHQGISQKESQHMAEELLAEMDLPDPRRILRSYPGQLSGGMCQRVSLAMALALRPKVLIADEPTSNLDLTIQADILLRLERLAKERCTSILFITHDLGIVARLADQVVVLYGGCSIEQVDVRTFFDRPLHPYTWGLLQSVALVETPAQRLFPPMEPPPTPYLPVESCVFLGRCPKATSQCRRGARPHLQEVEPGHRVACYNVMRYDWE